MLEKVLLLLRNGDIARHSIPHYKLIILKLLKTNKQTSKTALIPISEKYKPKKTLYNIVHISFQF